MTSEKEAEQHSTGQENAGGRKGLCRLEDTTRPGGVAGGWCSFAVAGGEVCKQQQQQHPRSDLDVDFFFFFFLCPPFR